MNGAVFSAGDYCTYLVHRFFQPDFKRGFKSGFLCLDCSINISVRVWDFLHSALRLGLWCSDVSVVVYSKIVLTNQ